MKFFALIMMLMMSALQAQALTIPHKVKTLINKKLAHHGPNCWGTALYLKGISPVPRFVSSAEITYWQGSSLCRPLDENDVIKAGDILNVYGPEYIFESDMTLTDSEKFINLFDQGRYQEATQSSYSGFHRLLHSETFVSKTQVFGKESPNKDDAFKMTQLHEVYGRPRNASECQESPTLAPHLREYKNEPRAVRGSKCAYFSKVYRCQRFDDFFTLDASDEILMNTIAKYQSRIFDAVVSNSKKLSQLEKRLILEFAETTIQDLLRQIPEVNDEETRMLLSWKYFSAYSLIESIRWIEDV